MSPKWNDNVKANDKFIPFGTTTKKQKWNKHSEKKRVMKKEVGAFVGHFVK